MNFYLQTKGLKVICLIFLKKLFRIYFIIQIFFLKLCTPKSNNWLGGYLKHLKHGNDLCNVLQGLHRGFERD